MKARVMGSALVVLVIAVAVSAQAPWAPPRTPDGHPDLQGNWYFGSATPLERPKEFEGKAFLTADEAAAFEQQTDERRGDVLAVHAPEWLDYGKHVGAETEVQPRSLEIVQENRDAAPLLPGADLSCAPARLRGLSSASPGPRARFARSR